MECSAVANAQQAKRLREGRVAFERAGDDVARPIHDFGSATVRSVVARTASSFAISRAMWGTMVIGSITRSDSSGPIVLHGDGERLSQILTPR